MSCNKRTIKLLMIIAVCCISAVNLLALRHQVLYSSFEDTAQAQNELRVPIFTCTDQSFSSELVVNGDPGDLVPGIAGKALPFDGSMYVQVPHDSCLDLDDGDFCITFWVKTSSTKTYNTIIDKRSSSGIGYHVVLYGGRVLLQLHDTNYGWYNYWGYSQQTINDGDWHTVYIYVDRDGTFDSKIYVDGVCDLTFNPTRHTGSIANTADLLIGKHKDWSSAYFEGTIDELVFYSW